MESFFYCKNVCHKLYDTYPQIFAVILMSFDVVKSCIFAVVCSDFGVYTGLTVHFAVAGGEGFEINRGGVADLVALQVETMVLIDRLASNNCNKIITDDVTTSFKKT